MINMQQNFIDRLKLTLPAYQNPAQSIADCLDISLNEAYKKIRNKSALTLQQIVKLSDTFKIPIVYQPEDTPTVTFSYPKIEGGAPNMEDYLLDLLSNLKLIHASKEKHLTIVTDDIPLFHLFKYPELTAFKLFFWFESLSSTPQRFERSFVMENITTVAQELNRIYLEIPSTEIWAKNSIHGSLEQIRYAFEAGYIGDHSLAEELVVQLRYCLTDMNMYAMSSKKTIDVSHTFNWYNCDVLGTIAYLAEMNGTKVCFNRFNTFNFLKTEDPEYCLQTKAWMQSLMRKSVSFSGQGEKHRNKYIYQAFQECDALIKEISGERNGN
ncbi:hypothetical protein SAMN04488522_103343 [Pedobacter caeni]|uniref:Transcription regulator BetR N-terminal domain-containing protein n=2 Tax=Pedobacter caeni TaxID=288992 RepID=A0A1M5DQI8_9SPHI|nr:hypothetical protein SAMN04488522_103343 [Pedobacter caeni]